MKPEKSDLCGKDFASMIKHIEMGVLTYIHQAWFQM